MRVSAPVIRRQFVSPAPDVTIAGRTLSAREAFGENIALATSAGLPCLVVPAGLTATGLPVGLEFAAPAAHDDALLSLGFALEAVLGPVDPPAAT